MTQALNLLIDRVEAVKTSSKDLQTFYGKKVAKQITNIFESIVAIETYDRGENRQQAIAEVFLHALWKKKEFQEKPIELEHFELIVGG